MNLFNISGVSSSILALGDSKVAIFSRVEGEVNITMANAIVAQLLLLELMDPNADITMYINSPGGEVMAGLAITDTMEFISCDGSQYGIIILRWLV